MIELTHIDKRFGRQELFQDLNLRIPEGRVTAVLGPNGSGKTTLIKMMLGLVIPDRGDIFIRQEAVIRAHSYRKDIGYLPQIARFPENLTVKELMSMMRDLRGPSQRQEELLERFGVTMYLPKRLGHLSGGSRQKINLVLALMYDSPLLILDEPTSGLDPVAMIRLKTLIQEEAARGKTILITSHIMNFVEEMSQDLVFLLEGKIHFQGELNQLKSAWQEADLERAIAALLSTPEAISHSPQTTR